MIFNIKLGVLLVTIPYVLTLNRLSLTKPVADGFGVNIHFTHAKAGELEMIAAAGFKLVRMDFFWDRIEQTRGEYNFKDYDYLMAELEKHKMNAIFIIDFGNKLYEKSNAIITEEGRKAYARFAAAGVDHFKGRGIIWEIWNEPNIDVFWGGHHNNQEYIAMALEAVKAIRAKTPSEILIGPATSTVDIQFLEDCFKAGLLNYWDAVSVHPYRQSSPETVFSDYLELKRLIAKYAPKGKSVPIISGEWGYSAVWKGFNTTLQGEYLPRQLLTNVINNIPVSIWYDWHDDGINKTDPEHHFGIVSNEYRSGNDQVYAPKDSYITAKTMNTHLNGYHYVKRIATDNENDYVLLFSNDHDIRLAVWTSSQNNHEVKLPSDKCDFEIIHGLGDKVEKTSVTDSLLTLKLSSYVHYVIVKGQNKALENATEYLFKVTIEPVHGKELSVRVYNLNGTPGNVTVRLAKTEGIEAAQTELSFEFKGESEKVISFALKSKPNDSFITGVMIEAHGKVQNFHANKFHFLPNNVLSDCRIIPDGDLKIKSEQSVSVGSAPLPLLDSGSTVLKIDYHFYGLGWKYLNIIPNKTENKKIEDQPRAFGIWIYGDNQKISPKMRLKDSSHQIFQLRPYSKSTIDWIGWRFVEFDWDHSEVHWNGKNDGFVYYPIEYEVLFLLDNPQHLDVKSTIYISEPVLIY